MQDCSSGISVFLKQYMQSLPLSVNKRKRPAATVDSSSQTSCDYQPLGSDNLRQDGKRRRTVRKQAKCLSSQAKRRNATRRRSCKGKQLSPDIFVKKSSISCTEHLWENNAKFNLKGCLVETWA